MKTFLWTSLFWIVAAIAWLLCLWFWNLWTQVLENDWIASFLPKNLQSKSCDSAVASAMEWVDWCASAEKYGCYPVQSEATESVNIQELIDSLNILSSNQETIYNQINDSFSVVFQNLSSLSEMYNSLINRNEVWYYVEEPVIDEREQQRLQIQAQIDALQNEMANL